MCSFIYHVYSLLFKNVFQDYAGFCFSLSFEPGEPVTVSSEYSAQPGISWRGMVVSVIMRES